ncbi:hypothetical protein [Mycoplasma leonicaptivi]|uniref:hypothetical protein n=1 Tax=Mycoplasma leonicaptivi TaxID=36742 RepID=UPI000483099A|nr:hypothetical protein [Mycoplasma leonicaptivi]
MSKIKIIDYKFENFQNRITNKEIIEKLKSLNFKGSENLIFDDVAINFSINGFKYIIEYCDMLYEKNIDYLIIWCSKETQLAIESCLNFIFGKFDFHKQEKIKLFFINTEKDLVLFKNKLNYFFQNSTKNNLAIMFCDGFSDCKNREPEVYVDILYSKFTELASDFLIKKLIYFVGKSEWLKFIDKIGIPPKNILITNSNINKHFCFFSETVLIILATQGVELKKLINGYKANAVFLENSDDFFNKSLALAKFVSQNLNSDYNIKNTQLNLFISYDSFLDFTIKNTSFNFANLFIKKNIFSDYLFFPENVSQMTQIILSESLKKLIIYFQVKQKFFDFEPSPIVNDDDLLTKLNHFSLNKILYTSQETFNNYLLSFNSFVKTIKIEIDDNSEEAYGELISLIYWAKIFYGIIHNLDPFE